MSLINALIPPRNYELVRDRIGFILNDELTNQFTNFGVSEAKANVMTEGDRIVDNTEASTIIVMLNRGVMDSEHPGSSRGSYRFDVSFTCKAKSNDVQEGAVRSSLKLQRLAGMSFAILQNALYATLGFPPDFGINRVNVSEIVIGDPKHKDALSTISGVLHVDAVVNEETPLLTGISLNSTQTGMGVGNNNGYLIENNNLTP